MGPVRFIAIRLIILPSAGGHGSSRNQLEFIEDSWGTLGASEGFL